MGRGSRSWFPPALLGFAQLVMVAVQLLSRRSPAEDESANLLLGPAPSTGVTEYGRAQWLPLDAFPAQGRGLPSGPAWLVALGVVLVGTAVWYAVARRPVRTGWFVLGTAGALLALPLLDLVGSWQFRLGDGLRGPLLATLGLLVLAAYERSRLVLVTAAGFAVVAVVLSATVVGVLLSAAVLFAGAFAILLRRAPDTLR
jgi:hypothetical protein